MKLYFCAIDNSGNIHTSVSTGTPMDLLRQVFVSLPTGEFNLGSSRIAQRVEDVDHIFNTVFDGINEPVAVIDYISRLMTAKGHDEEVAEDLGEGLMIFNLCDDDSDLVDFLAALRGIFGGTEYDLSAMTECQTTLIVRIEM